MFKMGCQKYFTKLQEMEKTQSEIKPIKIGKKPGTTYCLGCKNYTQNFKPEKMKMTNKVHREKFHSVVCRLNKCRSKTQQQEIILHFTNWCYKNKMKTYCVKCRRDNENIDPEMVRTKHKKLIMQSKCPVCRIKK